MPFSNPFADDPDRAPVFEQGYRAGFAEPEVDHSPPPLAPELVDAFTAGVTAGRDDRRSEPSTQEAVPEAPSESFSRFEAAPTGELIPIPDRLGDEPVRDDAQIQVRTTGRGSTVAIFNGPPDSEFDVGALLLDLMSEVAQARLEAMLADAAVASARALIRYGSFAVGVLISVLTPSPILRETRFRGYLPDGTEIAYVVLTPQP